MFFYSVLVSAKGCSGTGNSALGEGISNSRVGEVENRVPKISIYILGKRKINNNPANNRCHPVFVDLPLNA